MRSILIIFLVLLSVGVVSADASFQITSSPSTSGEVNSEYEYQIEVSNPDNESLNYFLNESPSSMTINSQGLVSWIPQETGIFDVQIVVGNETQNITQDFQIQITAIPSQLSANNLELGGANQDRGEIIFYDFEISNTGSYNINNLQAEFANVPSEYDINIALPTNQILAKSSITAQVSVNIPENQDSGREQIGQIILNADSENAVNSLSKDIFLETESVLEIEEIEVTVDGRRDRMSSPGTIDREAELGSEIELNIELKNNGDLDLEDVDVEIISFDLPEADGLEDFIRRIRSDRTEDINFVFNLDPFDVDIEDEPFDIEILVEGIDENDVSHRDEWTITLEIDRETRDVRFSRSEITQRSLTCNNLRFSFSTEIINVGVRDLSSSMVRVTIPTLGITEYRRNIDLDEGDSRRFTIPINLPSSTLPGEYTVEVFAHPTLSTSDFTDSDVFTINVPNCETQDEDDNSNADENNDPSEPIDVNVDENVVVSAVPVERATQSSNDDFYLILLSGLVVLLIIVLLLVLIKVK